MFVSNSAELIAALGRGTASDIVLANGVYDNGSAFVNSAGHRLYAANLGGAVLNAGLVLGGNGGPGGGLVRGLAFDVASPSKTLQNSIIHVWGSGGVRSRILDTTFNGNSAVGYGILVRQPEGLVVQRVRARNFLSNGIAADANSQSLVLAAPLLMEDLDVSGVSRPVPKSSNGTAEACVWVGNNGTVRRVRVSACAWMGIWTGTNLRNSLFEHLTIESTPVGIYMEHYTTASTFQRMRIASTVSTGILCEWADPAWGSRPGCVDNVIQDSTIESTRAGVYLDEGTTRVTIRRVRFLNQRWAAIGDYKGVGNSYTENDYSGIAAGAVPISFSHMSGF